MEQLRQSPLCKQSDIQVYRPSLDFFIKKILADDHFSYTRQMHGLWDAVIGAWILRPELRTIRLNDPGYVRDLAAAMSEAKQWVEGLYYDPAFYVELIEILKNLDARDSSFMFGVSDTYFYPESPPPHTLDSFWLPHKCVLKRLPTEDNLNYYKIRYRDRQSIIKLLLPTQYPFYDAMLWKLYAYRNEVWNFFKVIRSYPVIMIGPKHYETFDTLAALENYHHIPIHGSRASLDREAIIKKVKDKHATFDPTMPTPIYLFVIGSVGVYLVHHLHQQLQHKFLIDVGQAFNYLFDAKTELLHREFGYSQTPQKGRRTYDVKNLYGNRSYQSDMTILNGQVTFNLDLKLKDIWFEKIIALTSKYIVNINHVRRQLYKAKHHFYNVFLSGRSS